MIVFLYADNCLNRFNNSSSQVSGSRVIELKKRMHDLIACLNSSITESIHMFYRCVRTTLNLVMNSHRGSPFAIVIHNLLVIQYFFIL